MQPAAVPEPMLPSALGSHETRVFLLVLSAQLLGRHLRTIVLGQDVLSETRSVGGRIELERLLENDGLVGAAAGALGAVGSKADVDVVRERDADAAPERALERQQEARDDGPRRHFEGAGLVAQ